MASSCSRVVEDSASRMLLAHSAYIQVKYKVEFSHGHICIDCHACVVFNQPPCLLARPPWTKAANVMRLTLTCSRVINYLSDANISSSALSCPCPQPPLLDIPMPLTTIGASELSRDSNIIKFNLWAAAVKLRPTMYGAKSTEPLQPRSKALSTSRKSSRPGSKMTM
jgi:hypothetical protein